MGLVAWTLELCLTHASCFGLKFVCAAQSRRLPITLQFVYLCELPLDYTSPRRFLPKHPPSIHTTSKMATSTEHSPSDTAFHRIPVELWLAIFGFLILPDTEIHIFDQSYQQRLAAIHKLQSLQLLCKLWAVSHIPYPHMYFD
jgi:hypothetical protein